MLNFSLRAPLVALLLAAAPAAFAQTTPGVGIGTTVPDVSAALDIVSSSKGALLPRVADATALATPATGLLVFQTGAPAGFYYNAGTPAAPSWQQIATAAGAAVTASNGLTKTGQNMALGGTLTGATTIGQAGHNFSLTGGNVGLGTGTPRGQFDAAGPGDIYLVNSPNVGTTQSLFLPGHLFLAPYDGSDVAYLQARRADNSGTMALRLRTYNNGTLTEALHLAGNGHVGIGTTAPGSRLAVVAADNSTNPIASFQPQNLTQGVSVTYNGIAKTGTSATSNLTLDGKSTGHILLHTNGSTGNVGLGTLTPATRLSISPGTVEPKITLYDGGSTTSHYGFGVSSGQLNSHVDGTGSSHVFSAGGKNGNGTELMRVQGSGNVGIGTPTPQGKRIKISGCDSSL